jgi:hypothetical protein
MAINFDKNASIDVYLQMCDKLHPYNKSEQFQVYKDGERKIYLQELEIKMEKICKYGFRKHDTNEHGCDNEKCRKFHVTCCSCVKSDCPYFHPTPEFLKIIAEYLIYRGYTSVSGFKEKNRCYDSDYSSNSDDSPKFIELLNFICLDINCKDKVKCGKTHPFQFPEHNVEFIENLEFTGEGLLHH